MLKCIIIITIIIILLITLFVLINKFMKRKLKGGLVIWDERQQAILQNYLCDIIKEEINASLDIIDAYNGNIRPINATKSAIGKPVNFIANILTGCKLNIQEHPHSDACRAEVMKFIKDVRDNIYFIKECVRLNEELKTDIQNFEDVCISFYNYRIFNYQCNTVEYTIRGVTNPIKNIILDRFNYNKYQTFEYQYILGVYNPLQPPKCVYVDYNKKPSRYSNNNLVCKMIEFLANGDDKTRKVFEKIAKKNNVSIILMFMLNCRFHGGRVYYTLHQEKDKEQLKSEILNLIKEPKTLTSMALAQNKVRPNAFIEGFTNKNVQMLESANNSLISVCNDKDLAVIKNALKSGPYNEIVNSQQEINKSLAEVGQEYLDKIYDPDSDYGKILLNVDRRAKYIRIIRDILIELGLDISNEIGLNAFVSAINNYNTLNNEENIEYFKNAEVMEAYDFNRNIGFKVIESEDQLQKFITFLAAQPILKFNNNRNGVKTSADLIFTQKDVNKNNIDDINFNTILNDEHFMNIYTQYLNSNFDRIKRIIKHMEQKVASNDVGETGTFKNAVKETVSFVADNTVVAAAKGVGESTGTRGHDQNHYIIAGIYRNLTRTKKILDILNKVGNYTSVYSTIERFNKINKSFVNKYGKFLYTDDIAYKILCVSNLVAEEPVDEQSETLISIDNSMYSKQELEESKIDAFEGLRLIENKPIVEEPEDSEDSKESENSEESEESEDFDEPKESQGCVIS